MKGELEGAESQDGADRRRALRVRVWGSASLSLVGGTRPCLLHDLSIGGVLVEGRGVDALAGHEGAIDLRLNLPGRRRLELKGAIVRRQSGTHASRIGLAFGTLTPEQRRVLEEIIAGAVERERARRPAILLVDPNVQRREGLVRMLRAGSYRVYAASTALEALVHLQTPGARIGVAMVQPRLGDFPSSELIAYLEQAHPTIKRVLL